MKWNALTRRHFLQGPGKAALALPVLQSLLPKGAAAQTTVQKNFFGFPMMNAVADMYNNSTSEATSRPSVYMPALKNMTTFAGPTHPILYKSLEAARTDGGGKISEYFGTEFNPYLSKMLMMQGFDWFTLPSDHHHAHFGNARTASDAENTATAMASVDQVLAYSPTFYKNPALTGKSVHWSGFFESQDYFDFSWTFQDPKNKATSPIVAKNALTDPAVLWDSYFKGFTPVGTAPAPAGPTLRSLLVDQVLVDYNGLTRSSRLGKTDKVKIQQHIALLHETEKSVKAVSAPMADCKVPTRTTTQTERKLNYQAMNSTVVSIAACGLAHSFIGSSLAYVTASGDDWHSWSHGNGSNPIVNEHDQIKGVLRDILLDLVTKLDQSALLDDSLVFAPQEHSREKHKGNGIPVVTFGSAGGMLKTGQFIDYRAGAFGYPMNQMLANVLLSFGMAPAEFEALNRNTNANFGPANSGYGHLPFGPASATNYARFKGKSLSDWLPLIKA